MPWATSRRRAQLPRDWPAIRRRILQRDGHQCRWTTNGQRCPQPATDVDHRRDPDSHADADLWSLCADHHKAKTARESADARRAILAKARHPAEQHPGFR